MIMLRARKILLSTEVVSTGTLGLLGPIYAIYVEKIGGGILEASGTYAIFALIRVSFLAGIYIWLLPKKIL